MPLKVSPGLTFTPFTLSGSRKQAIVKFRIIVQSDTKWVIYIYNRNCITLHTIIPLLQTSARITGYPVLFAALYLQMKAN